MARFAIVTSKGKKGEHLTRFKDPFAQSVGWRCASFGLPVIPSLVAVLANDQTRSDRLLPFGRKPERNWISLSATLNVRGLSLPDQTRVVAARCHHDRLLVSLHRAVVSRLSRT